MGQNQNPWSKHSQIFEYSRTKPKSGALIPSFLLMFVSLISLTPALLWAIYHLPFWEEANSFSIVSSLPSILILHFATFLPTESTAHIFLSIKLAHNSSGTYIPKPNRYGAGLEEKAGLLQLTNQGYKSYSLLNETLYISCSHANKCYLPNSFPEVSELQHGGIWPFIFSLWMLRTKINRTSTGLEMWQQQVAALLHLKQESGLGMTLLKCVTHRTDPAVLSQAKHQWAAGLGPN